MNIVKHLVRYRVNPSNGKRVVLQLLPVGALIILWGLVAILLYADRTGQALLVAALPAAIATIWKRPEYCVGIIAVGSLFGGPFAFVSSAAGMLILLAFAVLLPRIAKVKDSALRVMVACSAVPLYMGLRLLIEMNVSEAITAFQVVLTVLVVAATLQHRGVGPVLNSLGIAGVAFLVASFIAGGIGGSAERFEGVSGNPNRMVLGILLLGPLAGALALRYGRAFQVPAFLLVAGLCAWLGFQSGSSQAAAGLIALPLVVTSYLVDRSPARIRGLLKVELGLLVVLALLLSVGSLTISDDVRTLSGRTPFFESAIREFFRAPLFGSGEIHVSAGLQEAFSAHSALLGIMASGGLVPAALWVSLLIAIAIFALSRDRGSLLFGVSALSIVLIQFVQSLEYVSGVWVVIVASIYAWRTHSREVEA